MVDQFFEDLECINTFEDEFNINWLIKPFSVILIDSLKSLVGTAQGLLFDYIIDELKHTIIEFIYFYNKLIVSYYVDCK